jgi:hypothetical protein
LLYADLQTGLIQEFIIGVDDHDLGLYVKAFGQDANGELYLLAGSNLGPFGSSGVILKMVSLQTEFSGLPPITAELTSEASGTDSTATGQALLKLNSTGNLISYQLKVKGIENVTMAHIHIAEEPGGDGPPAVWLYPSAPPAVLVEGTLSGLLGQGSFSEVELVGPLEDKTLNDLLIAIEENRAYVNVHTQQYPAGEIRGRLQ